MEKFQLYLANTKRSRIVVCTYEPTSTCVYEFLSTLLQCSQAPRFPFPPQSPPRRTLPFSTLLLLSTWTTVVCALTSPATPRRSVQAVLWLRLPNSSHLPKSASCLLLHYLFAAHRSGRRPRLPQQQEDWPEVFRPRHLQQRHQQPQQQLSSSFEASSSLGVALRGAKTPPPPPPQGANRNQTRAVLKTDQTTDAVPRWLDNRPNNQFSCRAQVEEAK